MPDVSLTAQEKGYFRETVSTSRTDKADAAREMNAAEAAISKPERSAEEIARARRIIDNRDYMPWRDVQDAHETLGIKDEETEWARQEIANAKKNATQESEVSQPVLEKLIHVAADSVGELRKVDVLRVLESNHRNVELAQYIAKERPDLATEVDDVMVEEFGIRGWKGDAKPLPQDANVMAVPGFMRFEACPLSDGRMSFSGTAKVLGQMYYATLCVGKHADGTPRIALGDARFETLTGREVRGRANVQLEALMDSAKAAALEWVGRNAISEPPISVTADMLVTKGEYVGAVKNVTDQHVIQDVGRGKLVAHERAAFDVAPVVDAMMSVGYKGGRVVVASVMGPASVERGR